MSEELAIQVAVETQFIEGESDPDESRYVFAYTIVISNTGSGAARLINRHWIITNGEGEEENVDGPGVVGQQPVILPGERFRYTSGAVLKTAVGAMMGSYDFLPWDENAADEENLALASDDALVSVPIAAFSLAMPNAVH